MSNTYQIITGEDGAPECIVQLTRGFQMRCSPDDYIRFVMEFGDISLRATGRGNLVRFDLKGKQHSFHRWIMGFPKRTLMVSHIDTDTMNNWQWNLEVCTQYRNLRNLNDRLRSTNTSGRRGVDSLGQTGKWRAQISVHSVNQNLGHYDTFEEAVAARESAEKKYGYYH